MKVCFPAAQKLPLSPPHHPFMPPTLGDELSKAIKWQAMQKPKEMEISFLDTTQLHSQNNFIKRGLVILVLHLINLLYNTVQALPKQSKSRKEMVISEDKKRKATEPKALSILSNYSCFILVPEYQNSAVLLIKYSSFFN